MASIKPKTFRDHSKGTWRDIQNSQAPGSSHRLALNMNSDKEYGSLVTRDGTTLINAQISDGYPCLGLHNYINSSTLESTLFAVFSNGTNNSVYDVSTGDQSLKYDTAGLKTRFLTYLDSCLRLNGTDDPKTWNGSYWLQANINPEFTAANSAVDAVAFTADDDGGDNDFLSFASGELAVVGLPIRLTTTDTLPTGLAVDTTYFVVGIWEEYGIQISDTIDGEPIAFTKGTGAGTHTATSYTCTYTSADHGLESGDIITFHITVSEYDSVADGILPHGIYEDTSYYIINADEDTFQVSLTEGGVSVPAYDDGVGIDNYWTRFDAFNISDMPDNVSLAIEWRDRVYVAGNSDSPDTLYYSSIANATTRTVSWDEADGAGNIVIEQEDNGGGISALTKVPGYMLIFKKWTMKRWDGTSTYPDDLVNQGVPSQECVCTGRGTCFFINGSGIWATNGDYPKKLSKWTVDSFIEAIEDWDTVSAYSDDKVARFSIGDVTVEGRTYNNVVLKYSHDTQSFDIYSYPTKHTMMVHYNDDDDVRFTVAGDDDGNVKKLDTGNDDDGIPITYEYESNDIDFGYRHFLKQIQRAMFYSKNMTLATVLIRSDSDKEEDYKPIGKIASPMTEINGMNIIANYFHIKIVGQTTTGNVKILGYAFPDNIKVLKNTKL